VGAVGLFAMRFLPAFGFLPNPLAKPGRTGNPIRVNGAVDAAAFVTGIKIIMLSGV